MVKITMKKNDLFLIGVLFLVTLAVWLPTVNIPYWWDSAGFIMKTSQQFLQNNFTNFVPKAEYTTFAHPPFFMIFMAVFWKVFGESLLVSHIVSLIFTLLAVFFTYLVGTELTENKTLGRLIGFSSAILLIFSPVFLAQVGIIYVEIPSVAFALMAVYFAFKNKFWGYLISSTLLILTKEVMVFVVFAILFIIFFYDLFFKKQQLKISDYKKSAKDILLWSIPLLFLSLWFLYHKTISGWWFVIPGRTLGGGEGLSLAKIWSVFKFLLISQWRFLAIIPFAFFFFKKEMLGRFFSKKIILLVLLLIGTGIVFGVTEFLYRYITIGLPFLYLLFCYSFVCCLIFFLNQKLFMKGLIITVLGTVFVMVLLSVSSWDAHTAINNWRFAPLEENLEYLNIINIGKKTVSFIERQYPDSIVATGFPTSYMLSDQFYHYSSRPLQVVGCENYKEGDKVDLVVFHLFSPGEMACYQLIQRLQMGLLIKFEENGKWIEIYKNNATEGTAG